MASSVDSLFHFAIQVIPPVDAFPVSFMVDERELGTSWTRRLSLTFNEEINKNYRVTWSNSRIASLVDLQDYPADGNIKHIVLKAKPNHSFPDLRGEYSDIEFMFGGGVS